MALKSGSLGTMLQGVSQQPDRVRLDGQVTEQINMRSDVTTGLSTRPSTDEIGLLTNAEPDMDFDRVRFDEQDYIIGFKAGVMRMWLLDGTEQTVVFSGDTLDYIGDDMQFHVVDKQMVLVNRDAVVAKRGEDSLPAERPSVGIVHALGGQFSHTYELDITFTHKTNGSETSVTATFVAPDGDSVGDAADTTAENIVSQLRVDVLANAPVGTDVVLREEVISIQNDLYYVSIATSDGEGGTVLRSFTDEVTDVQDLSRFAPNGQIVKVVNSSADEDDYWLKFSAKNTDVEDGVAGFGREGSWIEWYNPDQVREYDLETMPHVVERGGSTLTVSQGPWIPRPVGDDTTAPFASLVDKSIRDINGFESRIVMITQNTVVMSRTDEPFDLWRESATIVVSTDPIDFTSTKKDELRLDWIVPFDRDLIIVADPGDSQFIIRGGELDANNTGMVLTTEFQVESANARPAPTGRTILLPFVVGRFSGIKEFYTNSDNQANAADSLTQTQDKYIVGKLKNMEVSQNFNFGLFNTDESEGTVWVYEYLYDQTEALQSAWHKWEFMDSVLYFFFDNSLVYFVSYEEGYGVFLHSLNLNRPLNDYGFHTMLDRKSDAVVVGGRVNLPYRDAAFMQHTGTKFPGVEVAAQFTLVQEDGTVDYIFNSADVDDGVTITCGQRVDWSVTPTQVFGKDYQQRIDTSQKVTIQDYVVHLSESGVVNAVGTSPYSDTGWSYSSYDLTLDNDPLDPDGLGLTSGPVSFPWGERADYSTLTLTGNDIRPVIIHELAWVGQVLKSRGRRT